MLLIPAIAQELFKSKIRRHVILRGFPCNIIAMQKNKENKIVFIGVDVLTQKKYHLTVRPDTIMTMFVLTRQEFRILSIDNDVFHLRTTGNNFMESVVVDEWQPCGLYCDSTSTIFVNIEPHNDLHKQIEKAYADNRNKNSCLLVHVCFAPKQTNSKFSDLKFYPVITCFNK